MKKILLLLFICFLFLPTLVYGSDMFAEEIFEAKVIEIVNEKETERADGSMFVQQDIRLEGLKGVWEGEEIVFTGISDLVVLNSSVYKEGDKVLVSVTKEVSGETSYYILDYVRRSSLFWLSIVFVVLVLVIGRLKGLKSLISLVLSFLIIVKFIVPSILSGTSPLLVAVAGSLAILLVIIYITEGFSKKSNLAILSIFVSLCFVLLLSLLFTSFANLTGLAQEEAMFLVGLQGAINFKGLLLAGILIGTLGVLDDVVLAQIETVGQIREANPNLNNKEVFKMAFKVGNTHLGSMTNTLFLAYAGASLPLILLFNIDGQASQSFFEVLNNELIATEIVRTLVGSSGIALAIPFSTFIAVRFYKK